MSGVFELGSELVVFQRESLDMGYGHVELPPKGVVVAADFGVALLKLVKFAAGRGPYLAGGGRAPVACRFGPAWPLAEGPGPCKVGKEPSAASRPVSACNLTACNQMTAAVADTLVQRGLAGRGEVGQGAAWHGMAQGPQDVAPGPSASTCSSGRRRCEVPWRLVSRSHLAMPVIRAAMAGVPALV